jgi:Ner family transcriptional regulator
MRRRRWDRFAIKAAVHRRGRSLEALSLENGLPRSSCSVALLRRHPAGERAIAKCLGVEPAELWPSRYPSSSRASQGCSKPESQAPASRNARAL